MHRAAQEICVFQMGANQGPRGLTLYFCLHSGLLSEYQFFILTLTSSCQYPERGRRYSNNFYIIAHSLKPHLASLAFELPWLS